MKIFKEERYMRYEEIRNRIIGSILEIEAGLYKLKQKFFGGGVKKKSR